MNWAQHLQRLMGAVIIMISCLVASPSAFAHSDHERAAAPVSSAAVSDIVLTAIADTNNAIAPVLEAQAEALPTLPQSKRCIGGCCTSSHACCAVTLPFNAGAPAVPYTSAFLAPIEPPFGDGLDPEALRKPPRSFA